MNNGRITEAALLIANLVEHTKKMMGATYPCEPGPANWLHWEPWHIAFNRTSHRLMASHNESKAYIPPQNFALWHMNELRGVFSANEGYLNNADEFINDMKELLEKAV